MTAPYIEDTSMLSAGVSLSEEMLTSIAISLMRIADTLEISTPTKPWHKTDQEQEREDNSQFGVGA